MTPTRETIARAMYDAMAGDLPSRDLDEAADAVLRALDAAGLVVVPRDPSEAMQKAGVEAMGTAERATQARASLLLSPRNDFQRGADSGAIMACNSVNLDAAYRAMIAAAPDAG